MRKIFVLFLVSLLFLNLIPNRSHAVAPVIVKTIAGEAVEGTMIAIAEKAGITYANSQSFHDALKQSDYKLHLDRQKQKEMQEYLDRWENYSHEFKQKPIPVKDRPGVGRLILSSAAFLTGVDLLYQSYDAFKTAYDNQQAVNLIEDSFVDGASFIDHGGVYFTYRPDSNGNPTDQIIFHNDVTFGGPWKINVSPIAPGNVEPAGEAASPMAFITYLGTPNTTVHEFRITTGYKTSTRTYSDIVEGTEYTRIPLSKWNPPSEGEPYIGATIPRSHGDTRIAPPYITDTTKIPDTVEIFVPIKEDGSPDPEKQLNPETKQPINDTTVITAPTEIPTDDPTRDEATGLPLPVSPTAPPTTGTPTVTEPCGCRLDNPRDWSPWQPWLLLLPFLDLILAIGAYLFRLFEFIGNLPFISSRPVNNEAVVWLRSATIIGVNPWSLVLNMMTIGLSLSLYKVIRRLF